MKSLRKRKIAKLHGVKFWRKQKRDWWFFRSNGMGLGFHFVNDNTFLNVIKNVEKWHEPFWQKRIE